MAETSSDGTRFGSGAAHLPEVNANPIGDDRPCVSSATDSQAVGRQASPEPIAVIGSSCRVPGASNPDEFWRLLCAGVDAVGEIPSSRWDVDAFYAPEPAPGKMYTRHLALLDDIQCFDAEFFSITPSEAKDLDPQHRLLLELVWEALERAAIIPSSLAGTRTGVFIGISTFDYALRNIHSGDPLQIGPYSATGTALCSAAGRISYVLGLRGPSIAVDTACSSSLVAAHLACESLRSGECELAIVGGVNLILSPVGSIYLSQVRALSPDGRCKAFDDSADGYGRGEGAGVIILKRVGDARADENEVEGIILGSAVNHDGASNGFTAPSGVAQREVIGQALSRARVQASDLGYVEAHGTGTPLGDVIELNSLSLALGAGRPADAALVVGSVKSNIGHLEAAAGIVGLMKALLVVRHGEIPAHLHFRRPTHRIAWNSLGLRVAEKREAWPGQGTRRIAGVSGFGLSGTNAHMIVANPPLSERTQSDKSIAVFSLSARNEGALRALAGRYAAHIHEQPQVSLGSLAAGAAARTRFPRRVAWVTGKVSELLAELEAFSMGRLSARAAHGIANPNLKIAFLFTGQGSQYIGMGRELYSAEPVFHQTLQECDELFAPHLKMSLVSLLYSSASQGSLLDRTIYLQPAMFAIEYALARLWLSWGIKPAVVMGHSVGEFAAACIAGAIDIAEAVPLVAVRGLLMEEHCSPGTMIAISCGEDELAELASRHDGQVSIAAVNGPQSVVIAGEASAVVDVAMHFTEKGVRVRKLNVNRAFHSPLMDPIRELFLAAAAKVCWREPQLQMVSGLTGKTLSFAELASPEFWWKQLREPVRFADALRTIESLGARALVEIGPKTALLGFHRETLPASEAIRLPSLGSAQDEHARILRSAAELYVNGAPLDLRAIHGRKTLPATSLPSYPFDRRRHWIDSPVSGGIGAPGSGRADEPALDVPESKAPISFTGSEAEIADYVCQIVASLIAVPVGAIDPERPIFEYGVDSILLVEGLLRVEREFGVKLAIRDVLEQLQTVNAVAAEIARRIEARSVMSTPSPPPPPPLTLLASPSAETLNSRSNALTAQSYPAASASIRLFCFPPAGAGVAAYRNWGSKLPRHIELWPVQLPGRDRRKSEPAARDANELLDQLEEELSPCLELPFVLFGHSMGALLAFFIARRLQRRGLHPLLLAVSGECPPNSPRAMLDDMNGFSDAELIESLTEVGIVGKDPKRSPVLDEYLPLLRTDLALCNTFSYEPGSPLDCPISAFAGREDRFAPPASTTGWLEQTTGEFCLRTFPGDHSFVLTSGALLAASLVADLDRAVEAKENFPAA
jgi:acyl transferase domain-containing protein/surfactin synthase thioesterase subunit